MSASARPAEEGTKTRSVAVEPSANEGDALLVNTGAPHIRPLRFDRISTPSEVKLVDFASLKVPFVEKPPPGFHHYSVLHPKGLPKVAVDAVIALYVLAE